MRYIVAILDSTAQLRIDFEADSRHRGDSAINASLALQTKLAL